MQVDTLSQHVRSQDDIVVVLFLLPVCIEVLTNRLEQRTAVLRRDHHHILTIDATRQIVYRIDRLREHHDLSLRIMLFLE